jgi:hypothetical protein
MRNFSTRTFMYYTGVISILSLLEVFIFINNLDFVSNIVHIITSVMGLYAVYLYFKENKNYKYLVLTWMILQLVYINITGWLSDGTINYGYIYDGRQFVNFLTGLDFKSNNSIFEIKLNVVAIVYIALYKFIELDQFLKKQIKVTKFRENLDYEKEQFNGIIVKRVTIDSEPKSFIVSLNQFFKDKSGYEIRYCIISSYKNEDLKLNQSLNFKLYLVDNETIDNLLPLNNLNYVDWIEAEIG